MLISVQHDDFDLTQLHHQLKQHSPKIGAIVTFVGLVRDFNQQNSSNAEQGNDDDIRSLSLEHYPGMTEKCLTDIATKAQSKWQLDDVMIIHRIGELFPSDNIVFVGVCSAHRQDSFDACQCIMDQLKTTAPFWKKEKTSHGERWVESKQSDYNAADKWSD